MPGRNPETQAKTQAETQAMTQTEYLQDQVERAERLATSALDPLTIDRLKGFAAECRQALDGLKDGRGMERSVGLPYHRRHLGIPGKQR
jgi:hypothetical protein